MVLQNGQNWEEEKITLRVKQRDAATKVQIGGSTPTAREV
jgi:hypothetical protein